MCKGTINDSYRTAEEGRCTICPVHGCPFCTQEFSSVTCCCCLPSTAAAALVLSLQLLLAELESGHGHTLEASLNHQLSQRHLISDVSHLNFKKCLSLPSILVMPRSSSCGWYSDITASAALLLFTGIHPCWLALMKALERFRSHGKVYRSS